MSSTGGLKKDVPGTFPTQQSVGEQDEATAYHTLSEAVRARRAEYTEPRQVRIKIGSWNTAALQGTQNDLKEWFANGRRRGDGQMAPDASQSAAAEGGAERRLDDATLAAMNALPNEEIELYVLALQEVVDVSSVTEAMKPYVDNSVAKRWKETLEDTLPQGYQFVCEQQLIGLLLLVYASPTVASEIKDVNTTSVGTGVMGYMGNKGAVTMRIVLGDTTRLVFVNSHLSAGADKSSLERRNWDYQQILQRTRFDPISEMVDVNQVLGEQIGQEDFAFWTGDLNYRLEGIPGDDVRRLLMLHARSDHSIAHGNRTDTNERVPSDTPASARSSIDNQTSQVLRETKQLKIGSVHDPDDNLHPDGDPSSLQATIHSILPHDELRQQMKSRKAFHDGWREGPIHFLPTFKYDVGTVGIFDSSEKRRAPSWCDRILYRTRRDRLRFEARMRDEQSAMKKDEEMKRHGVDDAARDEDILFDYNPDLDGVTYNNADEGLDDLVDDDSDEAKGLTRTKEGFLDEIQLEQYTAHQNVTSSDHKPLSAVFRLNYDAVIPEKKAKVQAEVAKHLDKAENEARPSLTIVYENDNVTHTGNSSETNLGFEGVWFGDLKWAQTLCNHLTVANTSRVKASFKFIPHDNETRGIAPSYMSLRINDEEVPSMSQESPGVELEPGETAAVDLSICVKDLRTVRDLNDGSKTLDDVLVLHLEGGRDYFVPVRANWLKTSLSRSIDKLIRIPEGGIRKLQQQKPDGKSGKDSAASTTEPPDATRQTSQNPVLTVTPAERRSENRPDVNNHGPVRSSAPRELFRLTEAIEDLTTRCVAEWGMTNVSPTATSPAPPSEVPWLRYPTWPFAEELWTMDGDDRAWCDNLSLACSVLDSDEALLRGLPRTLSQLQTLYLYANLLIIFLDSMPDGILPESLWPQLTSEIAGSSSQHDLEAHRNTLQEAVMTHSSPAHGISFVLLTSMLSHIVQETTTAFPGPESTPVSPLSPLRRMTSRMTAPPTSESRRGNAVRALAGKFAPLMVRILKSAAGKSADRRRTELLEIFLKEAA